MIVVGAGPAGSLVARYLSKRGIDTLIIEEHPVPGLPIQCAGLISPETYEKSGALSQIYASIKGGRVVSPSGHSLHFRSAETKGLVIDRSEFDSSLLKMAVDAGSDFYPSTRLVDIGEDDEGYTLICENLHGSMGLRCEYLVGADGPGSTVRTKLDFPKPREFIIGYQEVGSGALVCSDEVTVFMGNSITPGFFSWIIPLGNDKYRFGIGVAEGVGAPYKWYKKLLGNPIAAPFLSDFKTEKSNAGRIPIGILNRCVKGKCGLIGDSAAMGKPISGGGIYPILRAAPVLAKAISVSIESPPDQQDLIEYQKWVGRHLAGQNHRGMFARKIYKKYPEKNYGKVFEILGNERVLKYVGKKGNIDRPLDLAAGVFFRAPKLATLGISGFSSLFGN